MDWFLCQAISFHSQGILIKMIDIFAMQISMTINADIGPYFFAYWEYVKWCEAIHAPLISKHINIPHFQIKTYRNNFR